MALPDVRPLLSGLASAVGPALKSLFATAALMFLVAIVLAAASYGIAADGSILRGLLASLVALGVSGFAGFTLAWKRALGSGILAVAEKQRAGSLLVHVVFDRMLGLKDGSEVGERGGQIVQRVERLPVNEAASKLRLAIIHQVRATPQGGGIRGALRRAIEARLLSTLELITLARFRDEAAAQGSIDLLKVRDELAIAADTLIADKIRDAMLRITLILTAVAVLASLGAAYGIRHIPF